MWNCTADHYIMHNPPTAQNWAIGVVGRIDRPYFASPQDFREHIADAYIDKHKALNPAWRLEDSSDFGIIESPGKPVRPRSLYLEQLRCRLGEGAVKALTGVADPYGR
jgi:hypothetical protein